MVARELSYNILVDAARSSGVDQAFSGVNKRIMATRTELAETLTRQKQLNAEITAVRRAGGNYQPLQEELDATKTRVNDLNGSIQEQQAAITENDQRAQRWGRRMRWVAAGAVLLSAALIALVQVQGQYSRSLVNAAEITGQTAEQLERMDQAARRLTGQSLSPDAWVGILDSMRQLQYQFRLGTDLTEDQLLAFQRLRLNPYSTAALGAQEWYEALLNVAPAQRAITAAAVPGLNAIYSALRPALEQNQSWNDVLAETVALSDETHQRYADTQQRLGDLTRGFRNAGTEGAATFLPFLEDVLNVIVPVTRGFAKFAEQNPNVIRALAAIGIGLGAVTIALWLANTAATFFAAITGVGLPLIAVAAAAAGAVAVAGGVAFALGVSGGSGASAAKQQEAAQAEAEERQRGNDNANADRVAGAVGAAALRNEAVFERSRQELDPILRGIECLADAHADEPTGGDPNAGRLSPLNLDASSPAIRAASQQQAQGRLDGTVGSSRDAIFFEPDPVPALTPSRGPALTSEQRALSDQYFEQISTQATVINNFYDTPDPAGEIVRETETAITRVNTRK